MPSDLGRVARFVALLALAASFGSCSMRASVLHPKFPDGGLLKNAAPLAPKLLAKLDGMYAVVEGGPLQGQVAVHAAPAARTLSIFAAPSDAYAIMNGGCIDGGTRVVFEGYWRHARDSDTGLVRLFLDQPELAKAACSGTAPATIPAALSLSGATGNANDLPDKALRLVFDHALLDPQGRFVVAAHHGACRTIDDCGASENSLESILMVESFGASVVEIDVRLTADGVPIVYHDENFDPRLSKGPYCHGPVADFTLADVRALCTLLYGERVPTLEEALDTVFAQTTLEGVWLDVKVPEGIAPALAMAAKYNAKAGKLVDRGFKVVVGMDESESVDAYVATAPPPGTPCLVELELDDVRRADCHLWGPRWTRGPMAADVAQMQAEGRAVVYWTIDEPEYIDLFITQGRPNGVLSDRPGLVFQRFQALGVMPNGNVKP